MTDEQAIILAGKYRIDHFGDYDRNPSEHTRDLLLFVKAIEQAARREALESALGICAAVMTDSMNKDGEAACEACIVAIRALMGEAP